MNHKHSLTYKEKNDGSREFSGMLYQGIIPSPEMMKEYAELDPTLPPRLIKWTEDESQHRRKCEGKIINHRLVEILTGNFCGL